MVLQRVLAGGISSTGASLYFGQWWMLPGVPGELEANSSTFGRCAVERGAGIFRMIVSPAFPFYGVAVQAQNGEWPNKRKCTIRLSIEPLTAQVVGGKGEVL